MTSSHKKQQGSPEERAEARRALAADPAQWPTLDDETFRGLVYSQCLDYGTTQDDTMIAGLHRLYHYNMQRTPEEERMQMCLAVEDFVEKNEGAGIMAYMPFLYAEENPRIISTAALAFSVLCPLENG